MSTKLILVLAFLGTTLTAKSQDTIKLPYPVAKQVSLDLISGDSAKEELDLLTEQLVLTEKKVLYKDSIIAVYDQKVVNYKIQIKAEEEKTKIWQDQYVDLSRKYKRLKARKTFMQIIGGAIVASLGYLYITK